MNLVIYREILSLRGEDPDYKTNRFTLNRAEWCFRKDLLKGRIAWTDSYCLDFWYFIVNTHELCSCHPHIKKHPYDRKRRFFVLSLKLSLNMFIFIFWEDINKCFNSKSCGYALTLLPGCIVYILTLILEKCIICGCCEKQSCCNCCRVCCRAWGALIGLIAFIASIGVFMIIISVLGNYSYVWIVYGLSLLTDWFIYHILFLWVYYQCFRGGERKTKPDKSKFAVCYQEYIAYKNNKPILPRKTKKNKLKYSKYTKSRDRQYTVDDYENDSDNNVQITRQLTNDEKNMQMSIELQVHNANGMQQNNGNTPIQTHEPQTNQNAKNEKNNEITKTTQNGEIEQINETTDVTQNNENVEDNKIEQNNEMTNITQNNENTANDENDKIGENEATDETEQNNEITDITENNNGNTQIQTYEPQTNQNAKSEENNEIPKNTQNGEIEQINETTDITQNNQIVENNKIEQNNEMTNITQNNESAANDKNDKNDQNEPNNEIEQNNEITDITQNNESNENDKNEQINKIGPNNEIDENNPNNKSISPNLVTSEIINENKIIVQNE